MVFEDLVPKHIMAPPRKPRMPSFDRLLYLQARVQAQVFRSRVRSLYGLILRAASSSSHEQAVPVHTRWIEP